MTFSMLAWFRQLYSLDTLDTRFTASANTPLKAAADSRPSKDARANSVANNAAPSKWGTLEFYVYYVVFLFAIPWMFKSVIEVSQGRVPSLGGDGRKLIHVLESHPTYATYANLLSDGWIFGRKVVSQVQIYILLIPD